MVVLAAALPCLAADISTPKEVVLENQSFLVAVDRDSGALTRLENKPLHWTIERRPTLGI
jgi:hypothetical protein